MSFRRLNYTQPAYLKNLLPKKQPEYILDFAQLERKSDYYRKEYGVRKYVVLSLLVLFFLSVSAVYGYFSLIPGANLPVLTLPEPEPKEEVAVARPTAVPTKVVESVILDQNEKTYSYIVQNGDSYARLVKRAVTDYSVDNALSISGRELNRTVYLIISGMDRQPLHPGNSFAISAETISETLMVVRSGV